MNDNDAPTLTPEERALILERIKAYVSAHLAEIQRIFKPDTDICIVIFNPNFPEGDFVMGSTDPTKAIPVIMRQMEAGPIQ